MNSIVYWRLVLGAMMALPFGVAQAAQLTVLDRFDRTKGINPVGSLIADAAGNLYGTTESGGYTDLSCRKTQCGTVFRLTPPAAGATAWTETVLFAFEASGSVQPGSKPLSGLLADTSGHLYGTTWDGGTLAGGTVFVLSPPSIIGGAWTETVLHSFNGTTSTDGAYLAGGLIADAVGNLYGTTNGGGTSTGCGTFGCGTVFKLAPPAAGQTAWTETVLNSFHVTDGAIPYTGLIADTAGNLYGTTSSGGAFGFGTVFELSPPTAGQTAWTETVLVSLHKNKGSNPVGLIEDGAGNFYGTAASGGAFGYGTVFKLSPPAAGQTLWSEKVVVSFHNTDGANPSGALIADTAGNFYGTTRSGGAFGQGTVFKLAPPAAGETRWQLTVMRSFKGHDGTAPQGALLADTAGHLFGATATGGSEACLGLGCGSVFEVTP